jgi:glutathione S-transferase
MYKIMGRTSSSNVQKVLWCCAELGIEYEREDAGMQFGKVDTPEFFALNPNRRVPVLIEGDFVLWESNSIMRYLAGKHDPDGKLRPADPQVRASAQRWMDWQLSILGPQFTGLFHGLARTAPENRDADAIAKSRDLTEHNLGMLDTQLGKTEYIAGDALSYGDIPVGIYAYRWYLFEGIERKPLPNLERWYAALCERQHYRDHVMVGFG